MGSGTDSPPRPSDRRRERGRAWGRASAALCLALASAGCGGREDAPRPSTNIVLVTLDTTRADHLETYGYFRSTMPELDALARESLVFERLIVPMATTLPTHLSILTGAHPLEHGVLANARHGGARFVPSASLHSFAEAARDAGYATAAFVSAVPLKKGSGIEDGFDAFDEPEGRTRRARGTVDAALAWLDARADGEALFLWVHLFDAHWPFEAPAAIASQYRTDERLRAFLDARRVAPRTVRPLAVVESVAVDAANGYDAELRSMDAELGRFFARLRARADWERTAVVVVGDHGEGLNQHGLAAHGSTWDEQLHAPLVMRIPGRGGARFEAPLAAMDVLPTLLVALGERDAWTDFLAVCGGRDALGAEARDGILSLDTGRKHAPDEPVRAAWTTPTWKLFRVNDGGEERFELYDLARDPFELVDRAREHPEIVERLAARLAAESAALTANRAEATHAPSAPGVDPELADDLRALGYGFGE